MAGILVVTFCSIGLCAAMAFLIDTVAANVLRLPEAEIAGASEGLLPQGSPQS